MHKALLLLKKIPTGRVTTYKELAKKCNTSPRAVGQILKNNKHPEKFPCYKVVLSCGKIGGYNRGVNKKILLLSRDGIVVRRGKIDIKKYFYRFS